MTEDSRPTRPKKGEVLTAKYAFTGRAACDLTVAEGEEIGFLEEDDKHRPGWYLGKSSSGYGVFPGFITHAKLPSALARSEDGSTVQKSLLSRDPGPEADPTPGVLTRDGFNSIGLE